MTRCQQLDGSRSAGKSGEKDPCLICMFAAKYFVEDRYQVAVVIDGLCAGGCSMSAGAFHFPESDVVVPVAGLIGPRGNRFREHNDKSIPIRLRNPIEVFRCRLRSAANTSEHEDHRWMGCEICRPMNDVGPAVSVMCEGSDLGLRWGVLNNRQQ
jgi:hypothetical protein